MLKKRLNLILFILFFHGLHFAHAMQSQVHLRTGLLNGSYDGIFEGEFDISAAMDVDYEFFVSNDTTGLFRFIQGLDSDSRPFYTYAGAGMRYYWRSKGMYTEQQDVGMFISSRPRLRFYVGGDLGVSQVIVKSFGPNVQSVANMTDIGANIGAIRQLNDRFGLEAHLGFSYGYGLSSTPTNGNTTRVFVGASYFF